ncbi:hypothetical protein [Serratia marcescens]|uniref:hypothetical protein n=1 Tax=Serratia marcescens TaxID=615 RepID=UPI00217A0FE2|nr:hypothetical protein [Serratia marcescens]CAI2064989.1 Uncharacterised protein [Serratia marcescens]
MKNIVENQGIKTDKPLPMSYEALKAERDALAVENAALNKSLDDVCDAYENGQRDLLSEAIDKAINLSTPATDAALAAIQAQGVEKFAAQQEQLAADYRKLSPGCYGETSSAENALMARDFAAELREAK